jgi:DNA-binding NarL/FixJ family response regulator
VPGASGRDDPPKIVMLSPSALLKRIADTVRAGAAGWERKDQSLHHLLEVIRSASRGEMRILPAQAGEVLKLLFREQDRRREEEHLLGALTPRERKVLTCLAEAAGRQEVAERLRLSFNSVRTHLQNLMAKLGVHSAREAVALSRPHPDRLHCGAS